MTLQHGNRVRKNGGEQMVRELECIDSVELGECDPTESEIRQRAHEIYLSRGGAPGNAESDWLQAEAELRARTAAARPI
jgi:hypothetical protein